MRTSLGIGALCCTLIFAAIILAGCTQTASPETTPATTVLPQANGPVATATPTSSVPVTPMTPAPTSSGTSVPTIMVNSTSNGDILVVPASNHVLVSLNENPTTGYSWNATVSKGLTVVSNTYYPPNTTLIGAGGYRQWILAPSGPGTYTFNAAYMRPWEGASSATDTFSLVIVATPK